MKHIFLYLVGTAAISLYGSSCLLNYLNSANTDIAPDGGQVLSSLLLKLVDNRIYLLAFVSILSWAVVFRIAMRGQQK